MSVHRMDFVGFVNSSRRVVVSFVCAWLSLGASWAQTAPEAKPNPPAEAKSATAIVDRATGQALQGDAAAALKALAEASPDIFRGDDADFRACLLGRFGPSAEPLKLNVADPWVGDLANTYMNYWRQALNLPGDRDRLETDLRNQIGKLLGHAVPTDDVLDTAEEEIQATALKRGFHVLLGRTPPLRELMLWKKLTVEQRQVSLPEGPQRVTINYLDDFVLRGWAHYATCGRRSAGGWTTDDALFAVVPAYKSLTDENFSINFVAHESQHFADKHTFPGLESWELEYRAKLVELALADSTQGSTLQLICESRGNSKDSPHSYANARVVDDISKRLKVSAGDFCDKRVATGEALRAAAKETLLDDSRRRAARGK